jgi:4-amino-4-deoxy-L-arabinose transferase-like glycosyltransferase
MAVETRAAGSPVLPRSRAQRVAELAGLLVLALVVVLPRLVALDADPPGDLHIHFITDEGWWAHNARQCALFGHWIMDEHNPPLYSTPLYSLLLWLVYKLAGVGFYSTRLLSGLAGVATCAAVYLFVRRETSPRTAFAATLLLGTGYFMLTNNRAGFVESTQLAFAVIAILAAIRSREAPAWGIASALALIASLLSKPSALPVGAVIVAIYGSLLIERGLTSDARARRWRAALAFAGATVVAGAVIAVWLVLPNWKGVETEFVSNVQIAMNPGNRLGGVHRLVWFGFRDEPGLDRLVLNGFLLQEPLLVFAVAAIAIARLVRRDPRPMTALERGCWIWVGLMLASIAAQSYQPDRRYLLLVPPLALLVALSATARPDPERRAMPGQVATWRWVLVWAVVAAVLALYARPMAVEPLRRLTASWKTGHEAGFALTTLMELILMGSVVLAVVAVFIARRTGLPERATLPASALLVVLVVTSLAHDAALFARMRYTIRDASRAIGHIAQLLPADRRSVVGNVSDTMSMETGTFAFLIRNWPEVTCT